MPLLYSEKLTLRPLNIEDATRVEELASDYEIAKTTLTIPHPYPEGSAIDFIKSVLEAEKNDRIAIFAIEEKDKGELIGIINISIQRQYDRGELAYWVGKDYWGKGYGTEAAMMVLEHGFQELQLNKIFAASYTKNPGSWRIMEKIGMKHEGVLRQHVKRFGEYIDLTYYSILKSEYESIK